jgi:hypothetical protein
MARPSDLDTRRQTALVNVDGMVNWGIRSLTPANSGAIGSKGPIGG